MHMNWKDFLYLLLLIAGFSMHYAAFETKLENMQTTLYGQPPLTSRVDRVEQAVLDIRDSLADIKDELKQRRR